MSPSKWVRRLLGIEKRLNLLHRRQDRLRVQMDARLDALCEYGTWLSRNGLPAAPMVVPALSCGLGNHLFQIAAAYALARRTGSAFAVNYDIPSVTSQGHHPSKYRNTLYKNLPVTDIIPGFRFHYGGDDYVPLLPLPHVFLAGYFQSERYFHAYRDEVRDLFVFPDSALADAREFLARDSRPTVGIHVRLGDHVTEPWRNFCTRPYFRRALSRFPKKKFRLVLCSDEPDRARRLIGRDDVEIFSGADELSDLALLSLCPRLVLSNSTFSWWASFLGCKKEMVLAPDRWLFRDFGEVAFDIYQPGWIRVATRPHLFSRSPRGPAN